MYNASPWQRAESIDYRPVLQEARLSLFLSARTDPLRLFSASVPLLTGIILHGNCPYYHYYGSNLWEDCRMPQPP